MVGILYSCNCDKTIFTKDIFTNPSSYVDISTLIVSATPQITLTDSVIKIDIWSPTNLSLDIYDFSTFKDSVSLVCDSNEKFCGDKELVLTDPAD